jgi:hypothetical protein
MKSTLSIIIATARHKYENPRSERADLRREI